MDTIHPPKSKEVQDMALTSSEETQESINIELHEVNIADGGEFLDDAIRMKEQPFGEEAAKENY